MAAIRLLPAGLALLGLAACTTVEPLPGTPEFAAAQVSRAYDCGLRPDRGRVMARLEREERPRFVAANQAFAVKAYRAPKRCEAPERSSVQRELAGLTRR
jgi:hypothetical protein